MKYLIEFYITDVFSIILIIKIYLFLLEYEYNLYIIIRGYIIINYLINRELLEIDLTRTYNIICMYTHLLIY